MTEAYSYIRFSSPEQEKGDSLRRQLSQSEAYAQAHGLTLDDSLRLQDRGLSAFHGIHRIKGALGEFHRLVEQGEVKPGSVLLVESLDRLSREHVDEALTQFMGLIRAGVKVVTLADKMEYDQASIRNNFGQLIVSLVIMSRAHEESATKSLRGRAAWDNKRKEAGNGHKLTAKCPAWLRLSEDRKSFTVLPEVAQVVNWIFRMKLEGKGSESIVRTLNAETDIWKPPPTKRNPTGGWRKSYVMKILYSRAVIGEYQPHTKANGKRTPEGEPVPNYFPAIVEPELFHQVQGAISHNLQTTRGHGGGRPGPINNLFPYIAKCAYCNGPMAYICKGTPPRGGSYLVCDNARRGLGCKKSLIRYDRLFEPLVLTYCRGLDPAEIMPGNDKVQSELSILKNQLQAMEGELAQVEANIGHLLDNLEVGEAVRDRLKARQEQKKELERRRDDLGEKIARANNVEVDTQKQLKSIRELIEHMAELDGQERINIRLNLRTQLRRLLDEIKVYADKGRVGIFFRGGEWRGLTLKGDEVLVMDGRREWKIPMFFQV